MHIQPSDQMLTFHEHQYALIDQAIVGVFDKFEDYSISLAPNFNVLQKDSYPILIKIYLLNEDQKQELLNYQEIYLNFYKIPLITLLFSLKEKYDDDFLKKYLIELFYTEKKGKFYLRRLYDPMVIIQLNWVDRKIDVVSNIYNIFDAISLFINKVQYCFYINKKEILNNNVLENIQLKEINYINRMIYLLKKEEDGLLFLEHLSGFAYKNLNMINNMGFKEIGFNDYVSLLFHMQLLGEKYIDLPMVKKMIFDENGYSQASKKNSSKEWGEIFEALNIEDLDLKEKVMYEY